MLIGYARVSTDGQHTDGQELRLTEAGCEKVFVDHGVSGSRASRPEWDACLAMLRAGDTLVIVKLDRIGRSLINLIDVVTLLGTRGVDIKALDQGKIDTRTPNGKMLFGILAVLAEWERDMIKQRTIEGLAAARARRPDGKLPQHGNSAMTPDKIATAKALLAAGQMSAQRIAEVVGVSRATMYRHIRAGTLGENDA